MPDAERKYQSDGSNFMKAILRISLIALFAALIAGGSFVSVPLPFSPVPIVLQNLFMILSGLVLGPAPGTAAQYIFAKKRWKRR